MKEITEDTFVGYHNGTEIRVGHLSRWAYNQLKVAHEMYEALELVDRAWVGDGVDMALAVDAVLLAKAKAEGGNDDTIGRERIRTA